jgi:transposase
MAFVRPSQTNRINEKCGYEFEGQLRHFGTIASSLAALKKLVRKLASRGQLSCFVYEAGPCGYLICRHLSAKGFDCAVASPSLVPRNLSQNPMEVSA